MNWVCYLLRCADDTLYCGITNDLAKRLAAHNAGEAAKYTRARPGGTCLRGELRRQVRRTEARDGGQATD